MHRRNAASILVIVVVCAACGSDGAATPLPTQAASVAPASQLPAASVEPPAAGDATVTITAETGVVYTFTVESCTSPGTNIANIQASGADGDLDLRASAEGVFRITGANSIEAQIDAIAVADDGSVTASGTLTVADAPDAPVPFALVATPGSCS